MVFVYFVFSWAAVAGCDGCVFMFIWLKGFVGRFHAANPSNVEVEVHLDILYRDVFMRQCGCHRQGYPSFGRFWTGQESVRQLQEALNQRPWESRLSEETTIR